MWTEWTLRYWKSASPSMLKHGRDRHERMLQKAEFDICELSLSNYLVAKSRGMPFTAIPVFPRRLFSLSQMWVNANAGISSPQELIGQKVGLSTFQTTLSVLARGDLQVEYGFPGARSIGIFPKRKPCRRVAGRRPHATAQTG